MTVIIDCLIAWISFENSCTQLINDLQFRLPIHAARLHTHTDIAYFQESMASP